MNAQEATIALHGLKWTDQRIADVVVSSKSVIHRIRHGVRPAPYHLGNALVALAKKELRRQEKARGNDDARLPTEMLRPDQP